MDHEAPDTRYAPPQSAVDNGLAARASGALAGRWTRLAAATVDSLCALAVLGLFAKFTPFNIWAEISKQPPGSWTIQSPINFLAGLAGFVMLHGYLLATRGQTIGKLIFKIRIARPDGARASPGRLALRYGIGMLTSVTTATSMFYSLVDILLIFRASRRCLHDTVADTIVVNA